MSLVIEGNAFDMANRQMNSLFGRPRTDISKYEEQIMNKMDICLNASNLSQYYKNGKCTFSALNTHQYLMFLYFASNIVYKETGDIDTCTKLYYLNKMLHGVELYFDLKMPDVFGVMHPMGSVISRGATYSNMLFFYQGCTVGIHGEIYPRLGENVILYSNSCILGDCEIGRNVIIATHTCVINEDIPDNCLVFGSSPNLVIKQKNEDYMLEKTSYFWKSRG